MTRDQVEHILRAAGAITGRNEWVIALTTWARTPY